MWVTWIEMITFSKCSQNVTLFCTLKHYLCTVWRPFLSCLLPLCQDKCSCSWNHSYEKVFRLQFYIYANQTRFHMASLALGLQRSLPKEVSDSIRRILWCMLKFRGYNWKFFPKWGVHVRQQGEYQGYTVYWLWKYALFGTFVEWKSVLFLPWGLAGCEWVQTCSRWVDNTPACT